VIVVATSALILLAFVLGEITLSLPTAHARLALWEMTRGRFAAVFWIGIVLSVGSVFAPWIGVPAAAMGLLGLLAYEHAYVQAGQAVPLA
jgi:hypothetical protein